MNSIVDLRSDTVTKPSPGMRKAMAEAEVGDDVFEEDPTVNLLQEKVAALLGKEAALFVPSGTMANQISIRTHTFPGDEVIIEADSHPVLSEVAAAAALSGVQFRTLHGQRGVIKAHQVAEAVRLPDIHRPVSRLICLENTHNFAGGTIYPLDEILKIREVADGHGMAMHLDGARLLNACVATGIPPQQYARAFDSVSLCLSKGLGAPVGSVIAGSGDFIRRARKNRKMFGGGMRQAGILAAAGLYALENNVDRLAEDHANAKILAEALAELPGIRLDPREVDTNIVIMDISASGMDPFQAQARLKETGVLVLPFGRGRMRAVTHLDVDRKAIQRAIEGFRKVFG
ncbi:MAG: low-specificity L-threonine aldolase [Thermodesulfobacteriota bacterium]